VERLVCAHCGDVIGSYEPIRVVLADGSDRHVGMLTLSAVLALSGSLALHEGCHPALGAERAQREVPAARERDARVRAQCRAGVR
jgi:hypothetical protein